MREAKFVATVFGVITACLFGGGVVAFHAAPQVSSRANIVEPASEERTISATETTTATRIVTTTNITTQKTTSGTSSKVITATPVKYETVVDYETLKMYNTLPVITTVAPAETVVTTTQAAVTEPATEAVETTTTQAPVVTTTTTTTVVTTKPAEPVTTEAPTYEEPTTEPPTEESAPSVDANAPVSGNTLPITDSEFIMLCNVVGHEAGSYWISEYDKALVVEVIMNRVNSPLYPNTIYGVLTQPYQFSGCESYVNLGTFSHHVTENVKNAVRLYFSEPESFTHGYFSFYGDGYRNYFR
ncbi:MAG: cell wall hydrolase [Ruminococcus sp.]|nr:cell wall hydrolase [Ruminococcus sp.]